MPRRRHNQPMLFTYQERFVVAVMHLWSNILITGWVARTVIRGEVKDELYIKNISRG